MKQRILGFAAAALLTAGLLSAADPAMAVEGSATAGKVKKTRAKTAKVKPADDRFLYGSQETQKMRDKRLARECRGAANGGACSGYTR